jgi:peroxiredoxin Q/BCP
MPPKTILRQKAVQLRLLRCPARKARRSRSTSSRASGWCFIYPKDFTSGCTIEAHNFQRDLDKYTQINAAIVGVSVDNVDSHKSFCTKEGLNFKLLADPNHAVVEKYGSTMDHDGTTMAARNTFLIDPTGVIRKVYVKVSPQGHSDEVLADLQKLQSAK